MDSEKGADIRSAVANAVVRGGWDLLELRPMRMSLEDIFLSLTTEERASDAPEAPGAPDAPEEAVSNA